MTKQKEKETAVAETTATVDTTVNQRVNVVYLTNDTAAPVHIIAKDEDGAIKNVIVAPTDIVMVGRGTLDIGGVKQFMDEKRLRQVDQSDYDQLKKEHDGALTSKDE